MTSSNIDSLKKQVKEIATTYDKNMEDDDTRSKITYLLRHLCDYYGNQPDISIAVVQYLSTYLGFNLKLPICSAAKNEWFEKFRRYLTNPAVTKKSEDFYNELVREIKIEKIEKVSFL